jgi:hypothetical protein
VRSGKSDAEHGLTVVLQFLRQTHTAIAAVGLGVAFPRQRLPEGEDPADGFFIETESRSMMFFRLLKIQPRSGARPELMCDGKAFARPLVSVKSAVYEAELRGGPCPAVGRFVWSGCLGAVLYFHAVCSLAEQPVSVSQPSTSAVTPVSAEISSVSTGTAEGDSFTDLLSEDLSKFWKCYHSDNSVPVDAVWKVVPDQETQELILICTGQRKGFLYTTSSWSDFDLTLEWKFPADTNGNSGILVFAQDEPRIWPTSMQVQLHQPKAGSVIPSGDARSDGTTDKTDLARPINCWNECRIISRGGKLTVEINGTSAGETTGITPSSGRIALQSEGSEVHFRRIRIRTVAPTVADPPA